jgi:pimeloyl-ACP methyl ester carboxylesterase
MAPWREHLSREGFAVAHVALTGHDPDDSRAWGRVTAEQWLTDLERAREAARARWPGAALSLCGYSLGATVGLVWSGEQKIPWRRALLVAPALRVRWYLAPVLRLAGLLLPGTLRLPSLAPRVYRAHGSTPLAAFRALQDLLDRLEQCREGMPAFPQLVIYIRGDELISTRSLLHYRARQDIELYPLDPAPPRYYPRHLAIDSVTLGEARWLQLTADVSGWLNGQAPERAPLETQARP